MDIKVEPLSPGVLTNSEMRISTNGENIKRNDSKRNHVTEVSDNVPTHSPDVPYKYQSTSMPVFPNMPYSTSYPYVPIRPAPTHSSGNAPYLSTSLAHVTADEPYDVEEEAAFEEKVPRNSTGIVGKRSHLPKRYKCAMCAYRTRYKSDLNRHVRKHAIATFNCDICNMPFKTVGNVEFHKRKEHSELVTPNAASSKDSIKYPCKMCPYGTQYSSDLTRHVRKHYVAKFHCAHCNKPFMTPGSLVSHKRIAHNLQGDDTSITIDSTEVNGGDRQEGNSESDLDSSEYNVDVNGNDKEDLENEEYSTTDSKHIAGANTNHIESSQRSEDDAIIMVSENSYNYEEPDMEEGSLIDGVTMSSVSMSDERREQNNESKHSCPYCDKTFGRKLVLDLHLNNVHHISNEENGDFVNYNNDYDLTLDMSIQELENSPTEPHRSQANQNQGPLRHKCPFCAYGTNYKSTYDRHVRKHELLCHICNVCRMPFITFGHLQRHIRDNHPDHNQQISKKEVTIEKQTCSYCEFEAESLEQLRSHCEEKHGQVIAQEVHRAKKVHTKQSLPSHVSVCGNDTQIYSAPRTDYSAKESKIPLQATMEYHSSSYQTPKDDIHQPQYQKTEPQMEEGVYNYPPSNGRYARLVSDFDDFASKPFACALCFYRCADVHTLTTHADNHLTGCNPLPVPETARFVTGAYGKPVVQSSSFYKNPEMKTNTVDFDKPVFPANTHNYINSQFSSSAVKQTTSSISQLNNIQIKREPSSNRRKSSMPTRLRQTPSSLGRPQKAPKDSAFNKFNIDRLIPTFSVHYRKDKTNPTKPYLCLMCRKRFRHLPLLKQHFRQVHNESASVNNQKFECEPCNLTFNTPMALQEHHEVNH